MVKLFVKNNESRQILREDHLKSLIDLEEINKKLRANNATLKDLVIIFQIGIITNAVDRDEDAEDDDMFVLMIYNVINLCSVLLFCVDDGISHTIHASFILAHLQSVSGSFL